MTDYTKHPSTAQWVRDTWKHAGHNRDSYEKLVLANIKRDAERITVPCGHATERRGDGWLCTTCEKIWYPHHAFSNSGECKTPAKPPQTPSKGQ